MTTKQSRSHARPDQTYFLSEFLGAINRSAFWTHADRTVAWRDGAWLDHVSVSASLDDVPGAPRITRIAINRTAFEPSREVLRVLGFRAKDQPTPRPGLTLDLTVLDRELDPLAPWLVQLIEGRLDFGWMIPPPPIDCDLVTEEDLHTATYAWSDAARKAHRIWRTGEAVQEAARRAQWQDWLLHGSGAASRKAAGLATARATATSATPEDV